MKGIEKLRKKNQTRCEDCGKKLNMYNRYTKCHACQAKAIRTEGGYYEEE